MFGNEIKGNLFDLGLKPTPKKKPERDSRRSFTQSQKNEILYQQDNRCAGKDCGHKKLDPRDIEFDHKKPWAAKGRTITENGRAVCGSCHNKITHNQRLKKVESPTRNKQKKQARPPLEISGSINDLFGAGGSKKRKRKQKSGFEEMFSL